jgi:hypothetical protein
MTRPLSETLGEHVLFFAIVVSRSITYGCTALMCVLLRAHDSVVTAHVCACQMWRVCFVLVLTMHPRDVNCLLMYHAFGLRCVIVCGAQQCS